MTDEHAEKPPESMKRGPYDPDRVRDLFDEMAALRAPYLFYLQHVVPLLGRFLLGNPENYRMLGFYTKAFGNCSFVADLFAESNLEIELRSYFFGCATGIVGSKPLGHP